VKLLYGSRYPDLASVLPYFAAVFLLRYANAGPSMILNVFGSWADRVVPVLAAVATLVAVALPLIPRLGLIGGGIALAAAHLVWWLVSLVRVSRLLAEARA